MTVTLAPPPTYLPAYAAAEDLRLKAATPIFMDRIDWTDSSDAELVATLDRAELWGTV